MDVKEVLAGFQKKTCYRFATGEELLLLMLGCLGAVVTAAMMPLHGLFFGDLTGEMVKAGYLMELYNNDTLPVPPDLTFLLDAVELFAIQNIALGVISLIFSYISIWAFNYVASKQIYRIRDLYLKSALSQDIGWYDKQQTGEFASRMSEDLMKLEDGIGEKVVQFLHFLLSFVGGVVLAFSKGWLLTLVCLSSLPVIIMTIWIIGLILSRLSKQELDAYAKAGTIAEQALSSIRTVVAFSGQESESKRYSENLVHAKTISVKRGFISGLGFWLLWFSLYAGYAFGFWYGVGLVIDDKHKDENNRLYDAPTMVTIFFIVMMTSMSLSNVSSYLETFSLANGASTKIFSVIDRISPINSWSDSGDKIEDGLTGNITFQNVKFAYPTRPEVEVLRGLNLEIKRGETVALVGSSGCGKSTCIQLIQRFYDPLGGQVMLDNNDVKDLNVAWLRSHIGVVGQEPVLFNTTIGENIRYGFEDASQSDIEEAAKKSNAHDFITRLPQGYKTLVGERGAQLSGGQKQRIAIARALVRNPVILLLDEATSALDTTSESKVQRALDKASEGRTTVIVAHRLSTIRAADKIVVLSDGKVVEQGTHKDLMDLKDHYYRLVTDQLVNSLDEEHAGTGDFPDDKQLMMRMTSVVSKASSTGTDIHEYDDSPITGDTDEDPAPSVSMFKILQKNMPEWPFIMTGSIGSIVMGFSMPVFSLLFGDILGVLAKKDDDEVRDGSNEYSMYFVIAGVVIGFSQFVMIYMYGIAGEKFTRRLRGELFEAMLMQEVAWFDDKANTSGSLCARLSGEASNIQGATGQRVSTIVQSIATLFLGIGMAMYFQWKLGLLTLAFTPIILIANFVFFRTITGENFSNQKAMEKSTKLAVEAVGNIRTVASLGRERGFHAQYMNELVPAHNLSLRNTHFRGIVYGLAQCVMFFAFATAMYYGGHLIVHENVHFEDVFKVSQALILGTESIAGAIAFAPNFQKGKDAAARIFLLLERKPEICDPVSARDEKWVADGNVQYQNVEFFYPTRQNVRVLRGLNLDVWKGKTVALVGQTGCGKSTCIQLLERFYDPVSGTVNLDKRDVASVTMKSLRSQLGIVFQEPVLFDRTIAENIAYGDNTREVSMNEIIEVAKKANIHNFISGLPLGYDTPMGEKGTQLSGGQKQRVAIARALIRNPRVLVLDEATSALDTESEKVVKEALDKAKEGLTCIAIAHRLSTIENADVICVIHHGKIAELGTHSELLAKHGLYHKLHRMARLTGGTENSTTFS